MIWIVREIIGEYNIHGNTVMCVQQGDEEIYAVGNSDHFRQGDQVFIIPYGTELDKKQESKLAIPPKLTKNFDVALKVGSFFPLGVDRYSEADVERMLGLGREHSLRR